MRNIIIIITWIILVNIRQQLVSNIGTNGYAIIVITGAIFGCLLMIKTDKEIRSR